jgi:hypothetical protein
MNDDYLWDRSGEPDPEIEQLEQALSQYRYQAQPISVALESQLNVRRTGWVKYAAVAAAVLVALAGFWLFKLQTKPVTPTETQANHEQPNPEPPQTASPSNDKVMPEQSLQTPAPRSTGVVASAAPRRNRRTVTPKTEEVEPIDGSSVIAVRLPSANPFIDLETARHIEQAQILLRSFRNTRDSGKQTDPDLSYEKQQSRGLLSKNILLRRDAEAKRNMPAEELLGSLEPFLLDIANLPDKPSNNEVRAIKERMQKKEIVSALQVYSAPLLSEVF